jgi:hypothetical protein
MSTKRASLTAALQNFSNRPDAAPAPQVMDAAPSASAAAGMRWARPASRVGKKTVAGHFDPAVSKQLRQIGIDRDRSAQDLLREALNDLFTKYNKPPIA